MNSPADQQPETSIESPRLPAIPIPLVPRDKGIIGEHFTHQKISITAEQLNDLQALCPTETALSIRAEASRDWWPLAMHWSLAGDVPVLAGAVCRPVDVDHVAAVVAYCNRNGLPLTTAGGRSGVCGASIPLYGGVVLDTTALRGVVEIDPVSQVVEVLPGTFGPEFEDTLGASGLTLGHYPQSFSISTVGGWVACRGAGQYSTRYGKIEDMVVGLEVVLADGSIIRTGGAPRAATGPDLNQIFVGSEGTLGVITRIWFRCQPTPITESRSAYSFADFASGLDACRRIMQRGATPAVLRLYDGRESQRGHGGDGAECIMLVLDEGDIASVDATMSIVDEECLSTSGCFPKDVSLVEAWMAHRNDTSGLQALTHKGFVVDTMEIAGPWSELAAIYDTTCAALLAVDHARTATCHLSHSYRDGACLYFTFAANPPPGDIESTYIAMWNAGTNAVVTHGGNLSHHHGIGLNRARFMAPTLGLAHNMLITLKNALDPKGILNPGKMGLRVHDEDGSAITSEVWP